MKKAKYKNANEYRRGGATKADIRIKVVSDKQGEATALVGVSKAYGKVGWRTHFIEYGTQFMKAKPFVRPSETKTATAVQSRFDSLVAKRTEKIFE